MKTIVVMPAYRAARTLEATVQAIPDGSVDELLLVDDASDDDTVAVAEELGIPTIVHSVNRGYGGNQKTCYREALARGADIVIMLHPDNQYDPRLIPAMNAILEFGVCDVILGCRIRSRRQVLAGGMPKWKYFANRVSTFGENLVLGTTLGDFHSGFRAYTRDVLTTIPFEHNSDDFAFDQEFIVQTRHFGFGIGDVPVPVRYFDEASSINFRRSMRYGVGGLGAIAGLGLHRLGVRHDRRFVAKTPSGRTRVR